MDAAVRSVATRTLGMASDSLTCVLEREPVETTTVETWVETVTASAFGGGGGGSPEMVKVEREVEEVVEDQC